MADDDIRALVTTAAPTITGDVPMAAITARARRRRSTRLGASALVVIAAVIATATAITAWDPAPDIEFEPIERPPEQSEADPDDEAEPGEPSDDPIIGGSATVFLTRNGWIEPVEVPVDSALPPALAVMEALVDPEINDPDVGGLVAIGDAEPAVVAAEITDGLLTVDVTGVTPPGISLPASVTVSQLISTGGALEGVEEVQILLDGTPVEDLDRGSGPFDASDTTHWAPVVIDAPRAVEAPGPLTLSGSICTPNPDEPDLDVVLSGPDDTRPLSVTTTTFCPARDDWSDTIELDQPGSWQLVISTTQGLQGPYERTIPIEVGDSEPAATDGPPAEDVDGGEATTATIFLVRDTQWIEPVEVEVDADVAPEVAVFEALLDADPDEDGLSTSLPAEAELLSAEIDGDVVIIDLTGMDDVGTETSITTALVDQLVHTGAALDGVEAVEIRIDGEESPQIGELILDGPQEPHEDSLVPLTLNAPADVDHPRQVEVGGEVCTGGGPVTVDLVSPDDREVRHDLTGLSRCPLHRSWSEVVELHAAGTWQVTVTTALDETGEETYARTADVEVLDWLTEMPPDWDTEADGPLFIGEDCQPPGINELPSGAPAGDGAPLPVPEDLGDVIRVGLPGLAWGDEGDPDRITQQVGNMLHPGFVRDTGELQVTDGPIRTYGTGEVIADGPVEGPEGQLRTITWSSATRPAVIEVRDGCPITTLLPDGLGFDDLVDYLARF